MATTNRFEHEHDYAIYFDHIISVGPKILHRYITFITAITGVNIKTASNYYRDLILLFKYVALRRGFDLDFSQFTPEDYDKVVTLLEPVVTEDFVCSVTRDEIIEFLFHLKNENDNTAHGRNRRLSAIKGFYNYLCADLNLIEANPTSNLKTARSEKKLPIFLTLEESKLLLNSVPYNANYFRNFCISIESLYTHVFFIEGVRKFDWQTIHSFNMSVTPVIEHKYSSTTAMFGGGNSKWYAKFDDFWPWLYAFIHNDYNFAKYIDNSCYLMLDFI